MGELVDRLALRTLNEGLAAEGRELARARPVLLGVTKAALERNGENLLIIRDKPLAEKYTKDLQDHFGHSKAYNVKKN